MFVGPLIIALFLLGLESFLRNNGDDQQWKNQLFHQSIMETNRTNGDDRGSMEKKESGRDVHGSIILQSSLSHPFIIKDWIEHI